jgi:hypothetical protein
MTTKTIIAALGLSIIVTPALAQKPRHHAPVRCADAPKHFSLLETIFSTGPEPQANGCTPAVYNGGRLIGQDPDPNVRLQLRRDPDNEGYHLNTK